MQDYRYILILFAMIFMHILDDFHLQGILANMKQKKWWIDQLAEMYNSLQPDDPLKDLHKLAKKYHDDWIPSLLAHAFQWSFAMMLPILIFCCDKMNSFQHIALYSGLLIINTIIHAIVDNLKCNKLSINLVTDQNLHIIQIIITWWIWGFVVMKG